LVSLILAFFFGWNLGANDAANSIATSVGSGSLTLRRALCVLIAFEVLGATLIGYTVTKTIGKGIVSSFSPGGAIAAVLGASIWILLCTKVGMPISTTHSIVGAILGYGLLAHGAAGLNWSVLNTVFASWVMSPLLAMGIAIGVHRVVLRFYEKPRITGTLQARLRAERLLRYLLTFTACYYAFSWGANDVANATGVVYSMVKGEAAWSFGDVETMLVLSLFGAAAMAVGAITYGYKVIDTIGYRITRLSVVTAFVAQLSSASCTILFTVIPYLLIGWGLPVSSTHATVGAVIGAGLSRGARSVSRVVTGTILLSWLLTVPCAAGISALIYSAFRLLGG